MNDRASLKDLAALTRDLTVQLQAPGAQRRLLGAGAAADVRDYLGRSPDVMIRDVGGGVEVLFLRTIVDLPRMEETVLTPLENGGRVPSGAECTPVKTVGDAAKAALGGACVVFDAAVEGAFAMRMVRWSVRPPAEPPSETVVDGPHNGFVEDLSTNIGLIRQYVRVPALRWETHPIGHVDSSLAALVYMEGVVRPDVLTRLRRALRRAQPRFVTDTLMLRRWLAPAANALFPTIDNTGRVDLTVAALMEGRVAILADGSPTALLAPMVFAQLLHAAEDYYHAQATVLVVRVFRLLGVTAALLTSAIYVALVTMNPELVPTPLYTSIIQARQSVPLSPALEIFALEFVIEFIQLAGLRLPGSLGQSVSIVGAVIIGQSAVLAGLVSAPAIVVVAFAFIVAYVVPSRDARTAIRLLRYPMILLATVLGLYGIGWGLLALVAYLASLSSFGVPYLAPLTPFRVSGTRDDLAPTKRPASRPAFTVRGVRTDRL